MHPTSVRPPEVEPFWTTTVIPKACRILCSRGSVAQPRWGSHGQPFLIQIRAWVHAVTWSGSTCHVVGCFASYGVHIHGHIAALAAHFYNERLGQHWQQCSKSHCLASTPQLCTAELASSLVGGNYPDSERGGACLTSANGRSVVEVVVQSAW
jgi:hypothetical protein